MELVVSADFGMTSRGTLRCGDALFDCALGRAGVTDGKCEGDGATPSGRFLLRRVLYRADRIKAPKTGLPITALLETDGWCDAPDDPSYNRPITYPYPASAEHLWRDDSRYDVIVILGHNDGPIVPGAGSAIFLHVAADNFSATEGCIALRQEDLITVLAHSTAQSRIHIESITP
jgi:L,D-peptidoglycan transpeptidase YkuD (ErfK/YbiS/YcfS/YnhG family)